MRKGRQFGGLVKRREDQSGSFWSVNFDGSATLFKRRFS